MAELSSNSATDTVLAAIRIRRSAQRFSRQLRYRRTENTITGTKRSVLGTLYRHEKPLTLSDLARTERLQPQSLTRVLAELEDDRLIKRTPDESDRRQVLISITEEGRNLLVVDAQSQVRWLVSVMSSHLSKAEQDVLLIASDLFDKICDASGSQQDHAQDNAADSQSLASAD